MSESIVPHISPMTRFVFQHHFERGERPRSELLAGLERWRRQLAEVKRTREFFDAQLAERLLRAAGCLLEELGRANLSAHQRDAISAAILYLVDDDDGEPDFESLIGLDDDAEVMQAVARFVGLDEVAGFFD
ncbi:MAG: hypothetical protein AUK47_03910 [Deltaproteobacteria bacterium CG2_30_63_29]|nr:MAG: hypothetical protein AUK47_03910 [Deltaproteobacteria bacterium CG2_30_63_29]PJB39862.1 MAG: hypothetical protein CO108_16315 [Deltaproteobacteria bacterium CG_4_9_14_3_um_filter_63_12]